jgi:hypothetical protein
MRTRRPFSAKRRNAQHASTRRSFSPLTKAMMVLAGLATVMVPAFSAAGPASAGSLLPGLLNSGSGSVLSTVSNTLAPLTQPVTSGLGTADPTLTAPASDPKVASPTPVAAPLTEQSHAPVGVTAVQGGTLPDLVVSWTYPTSGAAITGAVVQVSELTGNKLQFLSQITCGACTTATFRELTFGATYQARVFTLSSLGIGLSSPSRSVKLSTSCSVGTCVTFDTLQSIAAANHAYSGVISSLFPKGDDQVDANELGISLYRGAPLVKTPTTFNWSNFNVATAAGAQTIVQLQGVWDQLDHDQPPMPWANWNYYSNWVASTVKAMVDSGQQINYFNVYNEPGGYDPAQGALWSQETPSRLLEQFLVAYRAIKSADPNAQVMGPSLEFWADYPSQYGPDYHGFDMATFLKFAAANDIQLAALSWHEILDTLGANPEENTLLPATIEDHVAEARALIAQYPSLGNPKIIIDEYGMPEVQKIPGWDVGYLAALTNAGVTLASRSCFENDCAYPDLDGLLLSNGTSASPDFYDRMVYASMSGNMVSTTSSSDTVSALGSYNAATRTFVGLIGRGVGCMQNILACPGSFSDSAMASPTPVTVTLTVPWDSGSTKVQLSHISGATPYLAANAPSFSGLKVNVVKIASGVGTITFSIPSFDDGDAYGVTITH